jgi:hypothetical protein
VRSAFASIRIQATIRNDRNEIMGKIRQSIKDKTLNVCHILRLKDDSEHIEQQLQGIPLAGTLPTGRPQVR